MRILPRTIYSPTIGKQKRNDRGRAYSRFFFYSLPKKKMKMLVLGKKMGVCRLKIVAGAEIDDFDFIYFFLFVFAEWRSRNIRVEFCM